MRVLLFIIISYVFLTCSSRGQEGDGNLKEEKKMSDTDKTEIDWKKELNAEEYRVLRQCGTELPGSGKYDKFYEDGSYHCAACGSNLFSSDTKYASGSGWPSFSDVVNDTNVLLIEDKSHGMVRTEVKCKTCEGHLGHVFPDGPAPTYKRYCINSVSMKFIPTSE